MPNMKRVIIILLWVLCQNVGFSYTKTDACSLTNTPLNDPLADLCSGILGENQLIGGDFGSGTATILPENPGIPMDQGYVALLPPDHGNSCIANSTASIASSPTSFWTSTEDPTDDPNGYMLIVDTWYSQQKVYETEVTGLCENSVYRISADIINLIRSFNTWATHAHVEFFINGEFYYTSGSTPRDEQWHNYEFYYVTGPGETSIQMHIENGVPGGQYGDFAIDNIEMRRCIPQIDLTILGDPILCRGEQLSLEADMQVTGYIGTPHFQWQRFDSALGYWYNIPNATTTTLTIDNIDLNQAGTFRFVVASSPDNIENDLCWEASTEFTIVVETSPEDTYLSTFICEDESVTFNGITLSSTGEYRDTLVAKNGCDSLVVMDLVVYPKDEVTIDRTICAGESYSFGGNNYDQTGNYVYSTLNSRGCDSTTMLNLNVLSDIVTNLEASICHGESYTIGTGVFSSTGTHQMDLMAANGCDSVVILDLTVVQDHVTNLNETICPGESFTISTIPYTTSGNYSELLSSSTGCDSLVNLTLTVLEPITVSLNESICQGISYTFGTTEYSETGVYTETFTAANGCDSLVTLNLSVLDPITNSISESICDGSVFTLGNTDYSETGVYTETFSTANGCDSIVTLDLFVQLTGIETIDTTICAGEVIIVGGNTYATSGNFQENITTGNDCDSIVYLNLMVLDPIETNITPQICEGETYVIGTETFDTEGIHTATLIAESGCDSIVTIDLSFFPIAETTLSETLCEGDSITIGGQIFTTSGSYLVNTISSAGCDSTINLEIITYPELDTTLFFELCEGEYFRDDAVYQDTVVVDSLFSQYGCDSLVINQVRVHPPDTITIEVEICENDPYLGNFYENDTTLVENNLNINGCDSTIYTNITVNPAFETTDTIIIDLGNVSRPTESQSRMPIDTIFVSDTLSTVNGCDSIINILNLYLYPVYIYIDVEICEGELFNGISYFDNTTVVDTLTTVDGTDSIIYTYINILPHYYDTLQVEICEGDSYFVGGDWQTEDGIYEDLYNSIDLCDSLVVTELIVNPSIETEETYFICEGESMMIHGFEQSLEGDYMEMFSASGGCDSMSMIHLYVMPPQLDSVFIEICEGEEYEGIIYTASTEFTDTYPDENGCDSSIVTIIEVLPTSDTTIYVTLNLGETYEGTLYTIDTTFANTINGVNSCDSTIITIIDVLNEFETEVDVPLCEGEEYLDIAYFNDTTFVDTLTSIYNSDSIVTTNIIIHYGNTINLSEITCDESLAGTFETIYANQFGCDSLVITEITYQGVDPQNLSIDLCAGEEYNGTAYFEDTIVQDTLSTIHGCDSIITSTINVLELPALDLEGFEVYCATDSITLNVGDYETLVWSEVDTLDGMTISEGGVYYLQVTAPNGCSAIDTIYVPYPDPIEAEISADPSPCPDEQTATISVDAVYGGTAPYVYSVNGDNFQTEPIFYDLPGTAFEVTIEDANGCSFTQSIYVDNPIEELGLQFGNELINLELGDSVQLNPYVSNPYLIEEIIWTPAVDLSCDDCLEPYASPTQDIVYTITIITTNGCSETAEITIQVDNERNVFIPNTFTPDGDGMNDTFSVFGGNGVERVQLMQVFDRWGTLMYENRNFEHSNISIGWKGDFRGELVNSGVYVYYVEVLFEDGTIGQYKGDVTRL